MNETILLAVLAAGALACAGGFVIAAVLAIRARAAGAGYGLALLAVVALAMASLPAFDAYRAYAAQQATGIQADWARMKVNATGEAECADAEYIAAEWYHYRNDKRLKNRIARLFGSVTWSPYKDGDAPAQDQTIEHVVSRADAFRGGLCREGIGSKQARLSFQTDLMNLALASRSANSSKQDVGADEWVDSVKDEAKCWYAATVVRIKVAYDLWASEAEHKKLGEVLRGCTAPDAFDPRPAY